MFLSVWDSQNPERKQRKLLPFCIQWHHGSGGRDWMWSQSGRHQTGLEGTREGGIQGTTVTLDSVKHVSFVWQHSADTMTRNICSVSCYNKKLFMLFWDIFSLLVDAKLFSFYKKSSCNNNISLCYLTKWTYLIKSNFSL